MRACSIGIGLGCLLTLLVVGCAQQDKKREECLNNLRMLDAGTESWFLSNSKNAGDTVDVTRVCAYIKGGTLPTCAVGGKYTLPPVGQSPRCSIHGGLWEGDQKIPLFWSKVNQGRN